MKKAMNELNTKVFYVGYDKSIHIVFDIPYEDMLEYNIYKRQANVIDKKEYIIVATGTDKSLSHPTEFDHDKHTNLFFKKSTHELEFIDYVLGISIGSIAAEMATDIYDINSNMEYEYYVSAVNLLNNETFISREKIISTC